MTPATPSEIRKDLSAHTTSFLGVWATPAILAAAISVAPGPPWVSAAAWSIAFSWMGGACLINARRCGRLHCYFAGPIFLASAALAGLIALHVVVVGARMLVNIVSATLVLSCLTYLLERVWGKYLSSAPP